MNVYTVLLYSSDGEGGDMHTKTFRVDWEQLLPLEPTDYLCKAYFRSVSSASTTEDFIFVAVDGLTPTLWDSRTSGPSTIICAPANFTSNTTANEFIYQNDANDIIGMKIKKPTQQMITVRTLEIDGVTPAETGDWFMWLQITPIK